MRRIIAIMCLCAFVLCGVHTANAQSKKEKREKIVTNLVEKADKLGLGEKIPGWKIIKARATGKKTLLGVSFGYGNLGISNMDVPDVYFTDLNYAPFAKASFDGGTQWSIRLKIIFYQNKKFSVHTGIGYESNILRFKDVDIMATDNLITGCDEKLVARYFTVPLQFKYKLSRQFSVHAGVIGGVNFSTSHTGEKFLWTYNNNDYSKHGKYNGFNPFKIDAQAGFTLYHVSFYLKYGITNMFKGNEIYSVHPLSFGISLGI